MYKLQPTLLFLVFYFHIKISYTVFTKKIFKIKHILFSILTLYIGHLRTLDTFLGTVTVQSREV